MELLDFLPDFLGPYLLGEPSYSVIVKASMVRADWSLEVAASSPRSRLSSDTEGDTVERTDRRESRAGELLVEMQGPASVTTPLSASRTRLEQENNEITARGQFFSILADPVLFLYFPWREGLHNS